MKAFARTILLMALLAPSLVLAQTTQTFTLRNGKAVTAPGIAGAPAKIQISEDQKLMFAAARKMMEKDYQGAEALYTKAISVNNGNSNAYLQRGMVRRELHDSAGMIADARVVATLANNGLRQHPNNAD